MHIFKQCWRYKTRRKTYFEIEAYLLYGSENAIHLKSLSDRLGIAETTIKKYIRNARKNGVPICSDQRGYWVSNNVNEQRLFVETMRKHAFSRLAMTKHMKKTTDEIEGQISLNDWVEEYKKYVEKENEIF